MSHTFNNPNKDCITGSDYIKAKRRKAKYKTLSKNKSNIEYQRYDNTYNLVNCSNGNGYVKSAKSYDDLLDITVGKHLINPVLNGSASSNYDSWLSSFITVAQQQNNSMILQTTKKIHFSYDSNSFRPVQKKDNILDYILFGITLIKLYEETKFLGYVNSLLKICDIIISQNPISIVKYAPALKIIIEKELELVNQL